MNSDKDIERNNNYTVCNCDNWNKNIIHFVLASTLECHYTGIYEMNASFAVHNAC